MPDTFRAFLLPDTNKNPSEVFNFRGINQIIRGISSISQGHSNSIFQTMYLSMNPIHSSLLFVSEPLYKSLLNNVLLSTKLYIFVLAVKAIINRLM